MDEIEEKKASDGKNSNDNNDDDNNDDIKNSIKVEHQQEEEQRQLKNEQGDAEQESNPDEEEDSKSELAEDAKVDIKNESSSASTFDSTLLEKEPVFAEICSFFNMFAAYLNMKPLSFPKLEKMFSSTSADDEVSHDLIDLHLTLLRKIGYKSARFDKWETFLQKFLMFNKDEEKSVQLERLGYANLPLSTKLEVLFQLCGRQFDFNLKFKESIFNTLNPFELRFAPVGKDRNGLSYWYQRDADLNVRVYTEEPEDDSGSTWSLIARSHVDVIKLIESLKRTDFGQIKEENEDDIDESQILDRSTDSKKSQSNGIKKKGEELSPNFWKLLKPEVAEKYYKYLAKRNTFKDVYRDGSDLNKRKNEKLQKKEAKANGGAATSSQTPAPPSTAAATPKSSKAKSVEKEEEKEEEEEIPEIPPELLEDRRILPRRSARSNAITSIKSFSSTPAKKKAAAAAAAVIIEEKKKEESEEESSDDGDDMEDDDEESDRSFGRSDEEFNLPSKKGSKNGKARKPRKARPENDDGDTPPKPKKKKKKVATIAFEDSSDDEEEVQQEIKEKRKATALTLCMQCHKSSKPDVLLLCDMCDDAWHTFCLKPPLHYVPDDDWFCPQCHHAMLVDRFVKIEEELKEALKVKETEDTKKMQAAERLKREMEYIGVSLNNIIPSANVSLKQDPYQSMSESSESEDDGQRKSKKKAMKKVMRHSRKKEREQYYGPVVTVAEGRSRRSTKKVDYNFSAYDEQLQEAMDVIDEPGVKTKYENDHRPAGGLGRGKDMATIEDAQRKRSHDSDDFEDENNEPVKKKKKQKSKKLTDLDIDNATESEDDEYRASENEEEDPEPSEDDYVPSDIERQSKRRGRHRSDEEFIDDDESDEEYNPSGRKKKGKQVLRRSGGRKKRKAWDSEDDEESDAGDYKEDESSDDGYKKKRKKPAPPPKKRSKKNYSDDEEDDEEVEDYQGESSDSGPKKKTARGGPMRKAAAKAVLKESDDDEELGELDVDEGAVNDKKKNELRPIGALTRKKEEDEFKPDEEDDEEEEEEEEEEEVDENDDEEEEEGESEEVADTGEEEEESKPAKVPPLKKISPTKRKAPTPPPVTAKKSPPKSKKGTKAAAEPVKEEKPTPEPTKKEITPPVKAPTPAAASSSNPPSTVSTPKSAPTPPRQILIAPNPQQASHLMQQLPTSSPGPNPIMHNIRAGLPPQNGFIPYSTPISMQQHPNAIRFSGPPPPHSLYAAPPGAFYGPPPMSYGHPMSQPPPILPTYVMQGAPPQYGMPPPTHGFLPSNLTMLEPLQTMQHHHIPTSHHLQQQQQIYGGLQPIQHSQPSDSDGLAQAIAGAMNSDL